MRRLSALAFAGSLLIAVPASAGQTAQPAPTIQMPAQTTPPPSRATQTVPSEASPPRAPALPTVTANVKLDLTITDTFTGTPLKKTVSLLILNGANGMIRTSNVVAGSRVGLNIDAAAMIHQGGLITVRITFEYTPAQSSPDQLEKQGLQTSNRPAELHESLSVILQDGKPLLVSQSADPTTDRKVTVEVMATILK